MKKILSMIACAIAVAFVITLAASISDAGSKKKKKEEAQTTEAQTTTEQQKEQYKYQTGKPLYHDPAVSEGIHTDDSAPYSDPWYGKEETYRGVHGQHPGTPGDVTDEPQEKVIEGPVRYERVE